MKYGVITVDQRLFSYFYLTTEIVNLNYDIYTHKKTADIKEVSFLVI